MLGSVKREDELISNLCNYDILQNQRYADAFFYNAIDRREENTSQDILVKILLHGEDKVIEKGAQKGDAFKRSLLNIKKGSRRMTNIFGTTAADLKRVR